MCLIVWWTKITFSTWFLKNQIPCTISEDLNYKRRIMSHSYALISHSFFFRPLEIPFYFLWSIDVFLFPYCKTFFPYFYYRFFSYYLHYFKFFQLCSAQKLIICNLFFLHKSNLQNWYNIFWNIYQSFNLNDEHLS